MERVHLFVGAMIILFFFSGVSAQDTDPILGRLGDFVIKRSDMDRFINYHPESERKAIRENPDRILSLLQRMLEAKAVSEVAGKEKFSEKPEVKEQLLYIKEDFLSREYLKRVVVADVRVSEEDMKEFYRINEENLATPEQIRIRQILTRSSPSFSEEEKKRARERAQGILTRLRAGEDFVKAVAAYSEDPDPEVRKAGGDLGYFMRGQMIQAIEDAAFALKPGEISDLVETPFGFHIIKVEDYKEPKPRSFEEARELIKAKMEQDLAEAKAEDFIREAVEKAGMEIYEDRIVGKGEGQ